jgi:hypothetical protein
VAHHCAKYCRSFRSCNDSSRLTYRFSQRNSVSVTWCLQVAPPKGQVRVVASIWEPAMPMRRCEMKKVLGIYNNPDRCLVGDGSPVQPLFSYDMLGHRISPFLVLDLFRLLWRPTMSTLIKAIIPIILGLFIVPAQAQWLGPTWENKHCSHAARPRHDPCCGYPADPRQGRRNHRFLEQPSLV